MELSNPALLKSGSLVNGEWLTNDHQFVVENPANGNIVASINEVSHEQVESGIEGASQALAHWQSLNVDERSAILMKWHRLILAAQNDLALIMVAEQGKPMTEAMGEVVYGAKYIQWYAEEARRINGDLMPVNQSGKRGLVLRRPVGVVSAITPWNFPSAMILRKASAALAAGCSFIVKPSELTPLSALALAQLSLDAGIPAGVFNVVVGTNAQAIGELLTTHPAIAKFSFTGSTPVGKKLLQQCASTVKKTSMELGGNAPYIAFEDCDLDVAIKGAMGSKFRNSGQTCVCANRLFVHRSIYSEFVSRLEKKVTELRVGDGHQAEVNIGPLIEQKAIDKVTELVDQAVGLGAKVICGGKQIDGPGNFYQPTIITGVTPDMDIFKTEIFGPVASIIPFDSEDEVIRLANQTEYGLCSYAFTEDMRRVWRLSEKLQFGMVGINEGVLSNPAAPFGGVKESGMGREGGRWGIDDYLETRYVCIGDVD
ncbi:NAD-dependent succinate-semialdehyde dehydrogenase [Aliikangiella marina]|uniref:NAD-dependent succinate-semialdehyde dehydrogenase n=1 Tax=Aliikangiella marina TaxID=1712262 RepID=A0A545T9H6_9GAMM|nr:NAD-dependent succinate-semialdehyde dehydrogenase [Aliikangiella marina]TQV73864.1 NAD-dependent succinate-semialdehyde dehydrogenase [Aliikangiella marina]